MKEPMLPRNVRIFLQGNAHYLCVKGPDFVMINVGQDKYYGCCLIEFLITPPQQQMQKKIVLFLSNLSDSIINYSTSKSKSCPNPLLVQVHHLASSRRRPWPKKSGTGKPEISDYIFIVVYTIL
jgi:hypothetical protein